MSAVTIGNKPSLSERIEELLKITEIRPVRTARERKAIYKLRYEAYRRENHIPANDLELSFDNADDLPNQQTFGVYINGKLASSVRIGLISGINDQSPSMDLFSAELAGDLESGKVFVDPTRFVADREMARKYPELPYLTLRIATMASLHHGADYCLNLVRPEHGAFYRRIFRSKPISEIKRCSYLDMEVQLFRNEVGNIEDDVASRYPFFQGTPEERAALFGDSATEAPVRAVEWRKAA